MKINEATLTAFATSNESPVDKEGWLWKKGEVNKAFQKRYFVLKGNLLFYFEKRTDREPIGVIILEGCIIELAEEDQERFGFKISFHGEKTRVYHLGTEYQQNLEEWMKLLACASHDYMKLMVFELQQKLIELENIEQQQKLQLKSSSLPISKSANAIAPRQTSTGFKTSHSSQSLRQNPFTREDPEGRGHLLDVEDASEVFGASEKINCNSWANCHQHYGQKILSDRQSWYDTRLKHHQLVDVDRNN